MVKQVAMVGLLVASIATPSSLRASQSAQFGPRCLHSSSETLVNQVRRQQALAMAQSINRLENPGPRLYPPRPRAYRPLAELQNVPTAPADFKVQFYTDGPTYTFSLKDTADPCHYAIFSDQDQGIYEGEAVRTGARVVPAEVP